MVLHVTWYLNACKQETTKFSPFELVYGQVPVFPIDVALGNEVSEQMADIDDYIETTQEWLTRAKEIVQERVNATHNKGAPYFNAKHGEVSFSVGDLVSPPKLKERALKERHQESVVHVKKLKPFDSRYDNESPLPVEAGGQVDGNGPLTDGGDENDPSSNEQVDVAHEPIAPSFFENRGRWRNPSPRPAPILHARPLTPNTTTDTDDQQSTDTIPNLRTRLAAIVGKSAANGILPSMFSTFYAERPLFFAIQHVAQVMGDDCAAFTKTAATMYLLLEGLTTEFLNSLCNQHYRQKPQLTSTSRATAAPIAGNCLSLLDHRPPCLPCGASNRISTLGLFQSAQEPRSLTVAEIRQAFRIGLDQIAAVMPDSRPGIQTLVNELTPRRKTLVNLSNERSASQL
ncbi:hypothetical protein BV898_12532 [Hypsibius exemplaris]|uniref:Uncharacterized protein n=1 Tax=Hypsibius exemplaris TaxID=2072580 RepID=A0A1W0WDE0_HYPEX|nr:hypothetical protein BV898_12532 [Hypsibius exemplaris]